MTIFSALRPAVFAFLAVLLFGGTSFAAVRHVPVPHRHRPALSHASAGVPPAVLDGEQDRDKVPAPLFLCRQNLPVPAVELRPAGVIIDRLPPVERRIAAVQLSRPPPRG